VCLHFIGAVSAGFLWAVLRHAEHETREVLVH